MSSEAVLTQASFTGMSQALAPDPNFLPALQDRAGAYFSLKKFSEAIADCERYP